MMKLVNTFGRALGAVCGALLAVAWVFALWVPTAGLTFVGVSVITALLLTVLALFAVIASLKGHPTVLVLLFLALIFLAAVVVTLGFWGAGSRRIRRDLDDWADAGSLPVTDVRLRAQRRGPRCPPGARCSTWARRSRRLRPSGRWAVPRSA